MAHLLFWVAAITSIVGLVVEERLVGRAGSGLGGLAGLLLVGGLVRRGLAAGHWPLTNRYEFALCLTTAITAIYLLLAVSWREERAGGPVIGIALFVLIYALTRPAADRVIAPLLPALRSVWLQLHVLTTLIGYAAFAVGGGVALMRLVQGESHPRWPVAEETDRAMVRAVAIGFLWLTLGILTGAIWAQQAWGRYWGWDPKETWALISWVWYLLILHLQPLSGWRGRRLAGLVLVGLVLVFFTFAGVPWLVRVVRLESLHGF